MDNIINYIFDESSIERMVLALLCAVAISVIEKLVDKIVDLDWRKNLIQEVELLHSIEATDGIKQQSVDGLRNSISRKIESKTSDRRGRFAALIKYFPSTTILLIWFVLLEIDTLLKQYYEPYILFRLSIVVLGICLVAGIVLDLLLWFIRYIAHRVYYLAATIKGYFILKKEYTKGIDSITRARSSMDQLKKSIQSVIQCNENQIIGEVLKSTLSQSDVLLQQQLSSYRDSIDLLNRRMELGIETEKGPVGSIINYFQVKMNRLFDDYLTQQLTVIQQLEDIKRCILTKLE